jgi:hypothetical protein
LYCHSAGKFCTNLQLFVAFNRTIYRKKVTGRKQQITTSSTDFAPGLGSELKQALAAETKESINFTDFITFTLNFNTLHLIRKEYEWQHLRGLQAGVFQHDLCSQSQIMISLELT